MMSFQTQCPCGESYRLKDEFRGRNVKCKACDERFVAEPLEDEPAAPRRSRRPRQGPEGRRSRAPTRLASRPAPRPSSGRRKPVLIGLAFVVLVLVALAAAVVFGRGDSKSAPKTPSDLSDRVELLESRSELLERKVEDLEGQIRVLREAIGLEDQDDGRSFLEDRYGDEEDEGDDE